MRLDLLRVQPLVDEKTARNMLLSVVPDWEWLIARIEAKGGQLQFPSDVLAVIKNLRIENYPRLYENETSICLILISGLLKPEELDDFSRKLAGVSPSERGELLRDFLQVLDSLDGAFFIPKTPAEIRSARAEFERLSDEEKRQSIDLTQRVWMSFLAMFHQHLSLMVHGEKLTALVAQAKAGDTTAFAKAVQIDKSILSSIPYFRERFERAGKEADQAFLSEVTRRMGAPPYKGKIRHKSLWMAFAFLDGANLLATYKHEALLDLLDSAGVGGHKNRIEDVKNLSKRLAEYRRFQERNRESTP